MRGKKPPIKSKVMTHDYHSGRLITIKSHDSWLPFSM